MIYVIDYPARFSILFCTQPSKDQNQTYLTMKEHVQYGWDGEIDEKLFEHNSYANYLCNEKPHPLTLLPSKISGENPVKLVTFICTFLFSW